MIRFGQSGGGTLAAVQKSDHCGEQMRPGQLYWLIVGIIILGAVALRTLDPEPVARLRYLVFDTFVKAAPRAYDPDLPIRIDRKSVV